MPAVATTPVPGTGLADAVDAIRLSLHVAAATIWVGGQFTLAGLVPTLKRIGPDAPKVVAKAFARLMWPAFGVLLVTGIWNVSAASAGQPTSWKTVLSVKIVVVIVAGAGALLHSRATSKRSIALWGAVAALSSVAALVMGVLLAG